MLDKPIRCPWCGVKLWLIRWPQRGKAQRCPMCGDRYHVNVVGQALVASKAGTSVKAAK
jgi:DNA-directed RNA polymerase subunit RPC12/RpoP